jgi:hypothetical protein
MSVDVCVGVIVSVGMGVNTGVDAIVATSSAGEVEEKNAAGERAVLNSKVAVGTAWEDSAPNTAPTIARFTKVLVTRIVPKMRRMVSRMRISFSQCIELS